MDNFDCIKKILDCMEIIDDNLTPSTYETLYEYCCLKFGEQATGVAAYTLLVVRMLSK